MPTIKHCDAPGHRWRWEREASMHRIYTRHGGGWKAIGWMCARQHIKLDDPQPTAAVVNQPMLPGVE